MTTTSTDRPAPFGSTLALAWASLVLSVPLLGVAAWAAYDAYTSTSAWAMLGLVVTVMVAAPTVPAVVLAGAALRLQSRPQLARGLAVAAAVLVACVPLTALALGVRLGG